MLRQQSGPYREYFHLCRRSANRRAFRAHLQVLTKGGLHAVARALAIEYAGQGIRVDTVALGAIRTPMHKMEAHDFWKSLQPIGRMGEIDELVDAVMYLNDATFVAGEVLHVDGGTRAGKCDEC
jgi:NAD(P)-dependent dehydrogenase (short-subunit alcohol dehydrogenase family)